MANYFCTDSVEEQVDYLTDKVTDLNTKKLDKTAIVQASGSGIDVVMSQKAVTDTINENLQTINENLQTVNTELDGKLTKPANPTAESAVTMLADGTVGTKPLSEIGGGGGNLYIHSITITSGNKVIEGNFLSTRGTNYDVTDDFTAYFLPGSKITTHVKTYGITRYGNMPSNGYRDYDSFDIATYEQSGGPIDTVPTFSDYYVTEL